MSKESELPLHPPLPELNPSEFDLLFDANDESILQFELTEPSRCDGHTDRPISNEGQRECDDSSFVGGEHRAMRATASLPSEVFMADLNLPADQYPYTEQAMDLGLVGDFNRPMLNDAVFPEYQLCPVADRVLPSHTIDREKYHHATSASLGVRELGMNEMVHDLQEYANIQSPAIFQPFPSQQFPYMYLDDFDFNNQSAVSTTGQMFPACYEASGLDHNIVSSGRMLLHEDVGRFDEDIAHSGLSHPSDADVVQNSSSRRILLPNVLPQNQCSIVNPLGSVIPVKYNPASYILPYAPGTSVSVQTLKPLHQPDRPTNFAVMSRVNHSHGNVEVSEVAPRIASQETEQDQYTIPGTSVLRLNKMRKQARREKKQTHRARTQQPGGLVKAFQCLCCRIQRKECTPGEVCATCKNILRARKCPHGRPDLADCRKQECRIALTKLRANPRPRITLCTRDLLSEVNIFAFDISLSLGPCGRCGYQPIAQDTSTPKELAANTLEHSTVYNKFVGTILELMRVCEAPHDGDKPDEFVSQVMEHAVQNSDLGHREQFCIEHFALESDSLTIAAVIYLLRSTDHFVGVFVQLASILRRLGQLRTTPPTSYVGQLLFKLLIKLCAIISTFVFRSLDKSLSTRGLKALREGPKEDLVDYVYLLGLVYQYSIVSINYGALYGNDDRMLEKAQRLREVLLVSMGFICTGLKKPFSTVSAMLADMQEVGLAATSFSDKLIAVWQLLAETASLEQDRAVLKFMHDNRLAALDRFQSRIMTTEEIKEMSQWSGAAYEDSVNEHNQVVKKPSRGTEYVDTIF